MEGRRTTGGVTEELSGGAGGARRPTPVPRAADAAHGLRGDWEGFVGRLLQLRLHLLWGALPHRHQVGSSSPPLGAAGTTAHPPSICPSLHPLIHLPTHLPSHPPPINPTTHPSARPSTSPPTDPTTHPSIQPVTPQTIHPITFPPIQPLLHPSANLSIHQPLHPSNRHQALHHSTTASIQPPLHPSIHHQALQPSTPPSIQPLHARPSSIHLFILPSPSPPSLIHSTHPSTPPSNHLSIHPLLPLPGTGRRGWAWEAPWPVWVAWWPRWCAWQLT